ncbi:MAG: Gfo/Idh/MocA family oxidoreductase [Pirellulales bacterium]
MSSRTTLSRRRFTGLASVAGAGYFAGHGIAAAQVEGPNDKLNVAVIGTGGQGTANLRGVSSQNIVAVCDVDERRAGKAFEQFDAVHAFTDFRKMFDTLEKEIDAVVISTPDHTHFHPAWWAMERGKHVYLEKPLAHEVEEVRRLTVAAREKKLATQLGNQRHANRGLREAVAVVKSGVIGEVKEAHSWIASSRGMPKAPGEPGAVPAGLDWDLWLGPCPERPYTNGFAPYDWRFWWEFGTGETGNWGCHILDIPFWALDLVYPVHVSGSGPEPDLNRTPTAMTTRLDFPARGSLPPVALHWYQDRPPIAAEKGATDKSFNTLFLGSEGTLACGFDKWKLLPEEKFAGYQGPGKGAEPAMPPSPGFHKEWIAACRGGKPASCNFDYSGPMTESVLLANIAYRIQGEFDWDALPLEASRADATALLRREYRKGWEA